MQVSDRAKKRGRTQLGTLGAGNHYVEVQVSICGPPPHHDVHLALSRSVCMWRLVRSLASHCMHLLSGIMTRSVVPLSKSLQLAVLQDRKIDQHWLALLTWLSYGLTILIWECR